MLWIIVVPAKWNMSERHVTTPTRLYWLLVRNKWGGTLCLPCYHTGIIVIFCHASSLLSSFSSLGWCRCGDGGVRTLAAKCHLSLWACRRGPSPHPDRTTLLFAMCPSWSHTWWQPQPAQGKKGATAAETWEYCQQRKWPRKTSGVPPKKSSVVERSVVFPPYIHLTIHSSLQLSHILNLSIYLYSHLFTFSFKISAYKRVYKLKIIFFLFFLYKWHLQGKGVCGTEVSHCITRAYIEAAPNTV